MDRGQPSNTKANNIEVLAWPGTVTNMWLGETTLWDPNPSPLDNWMSNQNKDLKNQ